MTLAAGDLLLYASALLVLFLTPGPVWLALLARGISGGFQAAWPLALGVAVGDALWPLLAVLGVGWILSAHAELMTALRLIAAGMFLVMGVLLIRNAGRIIGSDSRLSRPGLWAGFVAGLVAILGNPKAILFYMGVLPGFFDLSSLTPSDVAAIVVVSFSVPLLGNLVLGLSLDRVRRFLTSPRALRRTNLGAGLALIAIAVAIPFV